MKMDMFCGAVKITDRVRWVGAVDWGVRDFHGYATKRGTTYNAFLVLGEKIALVDGVKEPFHEEMMRRVASVLPPSDVDYIISNHSEPDHSGSLNLAVEAVRPEALFASKIGVRNLQANLHPAYAVTPVEDGGSLSLGDCELRFFETKMLHWPDSMFTYLDDGRVLFTQDAFGMHLASSEVMDETHPLDILEWEAKKYYANILTPYSGKVLDLFARLSALALPVDIVAPDHGPVWKSRKDWILGKYVEWAAQKPKAKAVVVYDTMWGGTHTLARAIGEGVGLSGVSVKLMRMGAEHRSDVATELLDAGALVAGSPTLNKNLFPTMADVLSYIKGLEFSGKLGFAFGCYGWGGESVRQVEECLKAGGVEIAEPSIKVKFAPEEADLSAAFAAGRSLGRKVAAKAASLG